MSGSNGLAHAVADVAQGCVSASVEIAAPADVVFRAMTSPQICDWWVRPGVFDTREWSGDVRAGGSWRSSGVFRGQPYALEGEFLAVDAPRKLVHTWRGGSGAVTTVTYVLEPTDGGTRVTLRHSGFASPEACENTAIGWETSFQQLIKVLT